MTFLADNLEGLFVPRGTKNPGFKHSTGFGPTLVRQAFVQCVGQNPHTLRAALPWGDLVIEKQFDDDPADQREIIYLAYHETDRWIFVFDITEDLGLLFSDRDPGDLVSGVDIGAADLQFVEVCNRWIEHHDEKHGAAIRQWLNIRYAKS